MDQLPENPIMLFSVVNTKLRDYYSSLDLLCEDLDINREELEEKLGAEGFVYNQERNQFV